MDNWFSRNPYSKPIALLMLTALLVLAGGAALYATSGQRLGDVLWVVRQLPVGPLSAALVPPEPSRARSLAFAAVMTREFRAPRVRLPRE